MHVAPRRPGYGIVLLAIVLAILILSGVANATLSKLLALVVLAAALVLALSAAQMPARTLRRAAALIGLALAGGVIALITDRVQPGFPDLLMLVLVGLTPVVLARRLISNPDVTNQSLIGAMCVYLLIGLFFAFVFVLSADLTGLPFFASQTDATPADYVYFSYVTLATVGYGDFVARGTLGRLASVTEALTGQLYLVTVVALLVSNFRQRTPKRDD